MTKVGYNKEESTNQQTIYKVLDTKQLSSTTNTTNSPKVTRVFSVYIWKNFVE
jgi:hypothetical protein